MATQPPPLPGLVKAYTELVAAAVAQTLGDNLVSVMVTGSLALGDYIQGSSDLDLIVVCAEPLSYNARSDLPARVNDEVLPCPATGLDLLVFSSTQVKTLPKPLRFQLAVTTGVRWGLEVVPGTSDEEMLLDLETARRYGTAILGEAPKQCLAKVPDNRLRGALRDALAWQRHHLFHPRHDPRGDQGVLAACRAIQWLGTGDLVSKTQAGREQARAKIYGPLVGEALSRRAGRNRLAMRGRECRTLIDDAIQRLETL